MLQQGVVKDKTFLTGNEEEEERARQDRREAIIATAVCFVEMIVLLECVTVLFAFEQMKGMARWTNPTIIGRLLGRGLSALGVSLLEEPEM